MTDAISINNGFHANRTRSRAMRWWYVVALYFLAAFLGMSGVTSATNSAVSFLLSMLLAYTSTMWAVWDSDARDTRFLEVAQLMFFVTWPVATLVYLVYSRGWWGLGWWCLHAVGLWLSMVLSYTATYQLLY
jgi:hypothetical protein